MGYDFDRLKRMVKIYWVVQGILMMLLVYMAVTFQAQFRAQGIPGVFLTSIIGSVIIQLLVFYPVLRFARWEADNEIVSCTPELPVEQQKAVRQKRVYGDIFKAAVFIFFLMFSIKAPGQLFIQSSILFSFILTVLTYFQCYSFALKRAITAKS